MAVGSNERIKSMNISSEVILGLMTTGGAVLAAAVARMWVWFTEELKECKGDRKELHGKIDVMHGRIAEISQTVGRLSGKIDEQAEAEE